MATLGLIIRILLLAVYFVGGYANTTTPSPVANASMWHMDKNHDLAGGVVRVSADGPKLSYFADPIMDIGTTVPVTEEKITSHPNYHFLPALKDCGNPVVWDRHLPHDNENGPLNDTSKEEARRKRIVGGKAVSTERHPWMAQLYLINISNSQSEHMFQCAGTLITSRTVLTAAHCLTRLPPGTGLDLVVVGITDRREVTFCNSRNTSENCSWKLIREIDDFEVHQGYNEGNLEHDIGIVYLKKPVDISDEVHPVCLPYSETLLNHWNSLKLTVAGWGSTTKFSQGHNSAVLKQVEVDLQPRALCDQFHTRTYGKTLEDRICIGGNLGRSTCNGDSGGGQFKSLVVPNLEINGTSNVERIFQLGIISAGGHIIDTCGFQGRPTISTNVIYHMDWILNHILPEVQSFHYSSNQTQAWMETDKYGVVQNEMKDGRLDEFQDLPGGGEAHETQYIGVYSTGENVDVSNHPNIHLLPALHVCGNVSSQYDRSFQSFDLTTPASQLVRHKRVVGGVPVKIESYFPWMAQIYVRNAEDDSLSLRCSGVIISPIYILTAAHCVTEIPPPFTFDSAVVGQYNRNTSTECIDGACFAPINVKIEDVVVHPGFQKYTQKHNIALIRLSSPLIYTRMVQPICLPRREALLDTFKGQRCVTAGWGRVLRSGGPSDKHSEILLRTHIDLLSRKSCDFVYSRTLGLMGRSRLCGGARPSRGECFGDGGSPLMQRMEQNNSIIQSLSNKVFQVGIVSFTDCGMEGMPTVYTNVVYYMKWILDNLKDKT